MLSADQLTPDPPTGTPTIRPLALADYDSLMALWQASGVRSLRPAGRDSRPSVARQLESGVQTILGLEAGDTLVGAVVATHDSRKGWINRLAVLPWMRRQGFARLLIDAAEAALRAQGIQVIAALIEDDNEASLALFRSAGYTESEPPVHYLSKREDPAA
jgi:ribosomal protein S18 acetylase RimI-like enzyme